MHSVASDRRRLPGFPIRKSTDQRLFAAPRSLSQLITPFVACPYQGIHHEPYQCLTPTILHMPRQGDKPSPRRATKTPVGGAHRLNIALACSVCNTCAVEKLHYVVIYRAVRNDLTIMSKEQRPSNKCQGVVELVGFEPTTSCLQSRCSTN
jgi:hypothetical protein